MNLLLILLLALQDRPIEASIDAFLKGDAAARAELEKLGAFAIRPLQKVREKGPEKIDALIFELKKAASYPTTTRYDADLNGTRSVDGTPSVTNHQLLRALGRDGIPFFLDRIDVARMKSTTIVFRNKQTSLQIAEEICRLTGLDFGYFHNHIVLGMPDRLWPSGPTVKPRELAGADLGRARALVEQLAEDEIEKRETASRELLMLGAAVIPLLESQLKRKEAELVSRCSTLIQELRPHPGAFGPSGAERQRDLDAAGADILKKLKEKRASLEFLNTTLADSLLFFKEITGITFKVEGGDATQKLSALTQEQRVIDHLSLLTQAEGLDFMIRDGKVLIDTREAIKKAISKVAK